MKNLSASIAQYHCDLQDSRVMTSNAEIDRFEQAVEAIFVSDHQQRFTFLCSGFADATEQDDVMWSLLHAVEGIYPDDHALYSAELLKIIEHDIMTPHATEWLQRLVMRVVNAKNYYTVFTAALLQAPLPIQHKVKAILQAIVTNDPERFEKVIQPLIETLDT